MTLKRTAAEHLMRWLVLTPARGKSFDDDFAGGQRR
jgi:hypothetical protein